MVLPNKPGGRRDDDDDDDDDDELEGDDNDGDVGPSFSEQRLHHGVEGGVPGFQGGPVCPWIGSS